MRLTNGDRFASKVIELAFLQLLDQTSRWEEIYSNTSRVLLVHSQDINDQSRRPDLTRQILKEATVMADLSNLAKEHSLDNLAKSLYEIEKVSDSLCSTKLLRRRFVYRY